MCVSLSLSAAASSSYCHYCSLWVEWTMCVIHQRATFARRAHNNTILSLLFVLLLLWAVAITCVCVCVTRLPRCCCLWGGGGGGGMRRRQRANRSSCVVWRLKNGITHAHRAGFHTHILYMCVCVCVYIF